MSPLTILLIVWAAVTTILILLLIYRGTLTIHEDDQLFLGDSESHMALEQAELQQKLNRLQPYVRLVGAASGVVLLVIGGMVVWDAFNQM